MFSLVSANMSLCCCPTRQDRHVWPVLFIETGCIFEALLVNVENEALAILIKCQCCPGYCKQALTDRPSTDRQNYQ